MKNKILKITSLFLIGSSLVINAQSFDQGQKDINIGVGIGNTYVSSNSSSTSAGGSTTSNTVTPPLSGTFEFGVTDMISVGGFIGYTGSTWSYKYGNYEDKRVYSYYIFGAKGAFHFAKLIRAEKVDLYAGMTLGDVIEKETYTTTNPAPGYNSTSTQQSGGGFLFLPFVGCRYRFTDNFGVFGELGYGLSLANIGINLKF